MIRVFVDANIYLEAFKTSDPAFQKHVQVLVDHAERVFVTEQVVDEVNRNKLLVAARFVDEQLKKISLPTVSLPGFPSALTRRLQRLAKLSNAAKRRAETEAAAYFTRLANSSDSVSTLLDAVFGRALRPSDEVMALARLRKERGNPPGKKSDPLGDQISWEQLLVVLGVGDEVFIATQDGDYCLDRGSAGLLLMPFLEREVRARIGPNGRITLCRSLTDLVKQLATLPQAVPTQVTEDERRHAAAVERLLEDDDHDDDYDLCDACESDLDHGPHMVHWSVQPTVGSMRTGRCDWCNELSVNCTDCGFKAPLLADDEVTCDCDITVRHVVERNCYGETEVDEVVVVPASE